MEVVLIFFPRNLGYCRVSDCVFCLEKCSELFVVYLKNNLLKYLRLYSQAQDSFFFSELKLTSCILPYPVNDRYLTLISLSTSFNPQTSFVQFSM